ncbi:MAG: efflux RND transporter periplasmic adaptor subunit [Deltaproteobacteria bacterium]|nr:efflux RND transporter periplasmic adaptor subunit [Deltaproteobacteria bacterium]
MEKEDLSQLKIKRTEAASALPVRPRKKGKTIIILMIFLLVLSGILYWKGVLEPAGEWEITTVSLIYPSQAYTVLNSSGYVVAQRKAAVASKATGRLETLSVEEGNRVKKGQIIARLENADLQAAINQTQANVNTAQANLGQIEAEIKDAQLKFDRSKRLIQSKAIAQSDYDTIEAKMQQLQAGRAAALSQIKAAEAGLNASQVAMEYTLSRAPFDGVVLTKNADVGEVVAPFGSSINAKAAVVTMADMESLIVEADVSEINLAKVKKGQPCEIQLDALPGHRFPGRVHMIVPTADRSKATVLTKVKFLERDERILPEMSAKVAFLSRPVTREEQPKLAVPGSAIVDRNGKTFIYRLEGKSVRLVEVRKGPDLLDFIEVTQGLKAGERIVLKPQRGLRDGAKIKIAEK